MAFRLFSVTIGSSELDDVVLLKSSKSLKIVPETFMAISAPTTSSVVELAVTRSNSSVFTSLSMVLSSKKLSTFFLCSYCFSSSPFVIVGDSSEPPVSSAAAFRLLMLFSASFCVVTGVITTVLL